VEKHDLREIPRSGRKEGTGVVMNRLCRWFVPIAMFCAVTISACSKAKSPGKEAAEVKTSTEQAKEAIEDYGRRPIGKAKKAQALGDDRLKGIDEAMKNIDK
jgi:hypothetical protein